MYAELNQKYPALVNRRRVLLQQDNASPHTARKMKEKLRELDATKLLLHPAYRPDPALSDFHLSRQWHISCMDAASKQSKMSRWGAMNFLPQGIRCGTTVELNCSPEDGFRLESSGLYF
jgi:hypothetical protein